MVEPSILSWSIVIFIILTGWLFLTPEDFDDEN
jgi:hypothetical protein